MLLEMPLRLHARIMCRVYTWPWCRCSISLTIQQFPLPVNRKALQHLLWWQDTMGQHFSETSLNKKHHSLFWKIPSPIFFHCKIRCQDSSRCLKGWCKPDASLTTNCSCNLIEDKTTIYGNLQATELNSSAHVLYSVGWKDGAANSVTVIQPKVPWFDTELG